MLELDLNSIAMELRANAWQQWHKDIFHDRVRLGDAPRTEAINGSIKQISLGDGELFHLKAAFTSVQHGTGAPDATGSPRRAAGYSAMTILKGECEVRQDGRVSRLTPGDLVFLFGGRAFEKKMVLGTELLLLRIPLQHVQSRQPGALRHVNYRHQADEPGTRFFRLMLAESLNLANQMSASQRQDLLSNLIDAMSLPTLDQGSAHSRSAVRVEKALSQIDLLLCDSHLTPELVAGELGMSRRRLDEIFVQELGKPVAKTIWDLRLMRAHKILSDERQQSVPITEVALSVGFENVSHFSRAFKRHFGCTPGACRQLGLM